ncbi:MAG TPA: hypothetical protein VFH45_11665 [Acidimicrobiales bacterium]|nr:hypothetical protein [Acidimicrobiales bacterium]
MADPIARPSGAGPRPAYYAAGRGPWRDWWTLLHPPYTAWHLAYVVIGAALAPRVDGGRLAATVLAFFAAVGVAAHTLDEHHGRPLRTGVPDRVLVAATAIGVAAAIALGAAGIAVVGPVLVPFVVVGPALVVAYNAELFGGVVHTDAGFAAAWGAFPVLAAYVAQAGGLGWPAVAAAAGAFALSYAQRSLSTPARLLRRRATTVSGEVHLSDGTTMLIDRAALLAPLERALSATSAACVALAVALVALRLG